ncbi:MAG: N-acetylmuramoyl-L-alanine amidase-like domain-containing protein [Bacteroidota bacterium]
MKKNIIVVSVFMLIVVISLFMYSTFLIAQDNKIYEMSKWEVDSILTLKSSEQLTVTERMNYFSNLFLGMPYGLTCVGDGPYALYDTQPLLTLDTTNCMVFCEDVLALSISDSYENFFNNLQEIRYKDGVIGMKTRNHYTMADWLPENSWLLHDVVKEVAGERAKTITRTISHKNFFEQKGITDMRYVKDDREMTVNYIPFDALMDVKENFKDGDILALLFRNLDNIFSAHMLMAYDTPNGKVIRESSLSKNTALDTPYDEWVEKYQDSKKYIGIALMRVNDDLNKSGKIILPWEISKLKENKN